MADLIDRDALLETLKPDENATGKIPSLHETLKQFARGKIERAPAVNRWIPCAERMPDKRELVLCFCLANITEVLYWNGSSWHSTDAYRGYLSGFVTHWMPLPEPPEKEGMKSDT